MSTTLTFSPYAWMKLQYMCHKGDTEVAGFGVTSKEDRLHVVDFKLIPQISSMASFEFEDKGYADYIDDSIEAGKDPENFLRIWIHTHPGSSPTPSDVDESTLSEKFNRFPWIIMFILARGGDTYARMRILPHEKTNLIVPSMDITMDVTVSWKRNKDDLIRVVTAEDEWEKEYTDNIKQRRYSSQAWSGKIWSPASYGPYSQQNQPVSYTPTHEGRLSKKMRKKLAREQALRQAYYDDHSGYVMHSGGVVDQDQPELSDSQRDTSYMGIQQDSGQIVLPSAKDLQADMETRQSSLYIPEVDPDLLSEEEWQAYVEARGHLKTYDEPLDPEELMMLNNEHKELSDSSQDIFEEVQLMSPNEMDKLVDKKASNPAEIDDEAAWAEILL